MNAIIWLRVIVSALVALLTTVGAAFAGEGYGGIEAADDSRRYNEFWRTRAWAQQLDAVEQLKWYAAQPLAPGVVAVRDPPSLDAVYARIRPRRFGPYEEFVENRAGVFEPWPAVPGDVFGYPYLNPAPQPLGHWSGQTGSARWEYHPVWPGDAVAWPARLPAPPSREQPRHDHDSGPGRPAPPPIPAGELTGRRAWLPTSARPPR